MSSDRLETARQELARRVLAEQSLVDFCAYVDPEARRSEDGDPFRENWYRAHHLMLIADYLERAENGSLWRHLPGDGKKILIITTPPRHWKSSLVSRKFPAWFVGRRKAANQPHQVILTSYGASLAEANNRSVLELLNSDRYRNVFPGVVLSSKSQAVQEWSLAGEAFPTAVAAGVGGGLTGQGADCLIIDDPVKDRAEANSPTFRLRLWQWWEDVARTRMNPDGFCVIVMTRWHPDDLVGKLLAQNAETPGSERIFHLRLPALAETPAERAAAAEMGLPYDDGDPLNRAPGAALWPERQSAAEHQATRQATPKTFDSLFQGRPTPDGGYLGGRELFKVLPAAPSVHVRWCWATDWALKEKEAAGKGKDDPDYTAMGLIGLWQPDGNPTDSRLVIARIERAQLNFHDAKRMVKSLALKADARIPIVGADNGAQIAVDHLALDGLRRDPQLLNHRVKGITIRGDKVTRAQPWLDRLHGGTVYVVAGSWNEAFFLEVETFPNGANDDQVDMVSVGAHFLGLGQKERKAASAVVQGFGR